MAEPDLKPDTLSSDFDAMQACWSQVSAILGGVTTMRAAGEKYLPKFADEDKNVYEFRRKYARYTNVYRDIVENLAAKPFTKEIGVTEASASPRMTELVEDIDAKGNNFHVFAQTTFFTGIAYGVDWILVDYTKDVPATATLADEKALGARPYFVAIPTTRMIAVYSDMVDGEETFVHVRYREDATERDGFSEVSKKRIRVWHRDRLEGGGYAPAKWFLFEQVKQEQNGKLQWVEIEQGEVTIGIIPIVPFLTGRRVGSSWQIIPPMQDAADLQIEVYQAENGLKFIKETSCYPMLSGNGVEPREGADGEPLPIRVGPMQVLYTGTASTGRPGSWTFIEPQANSLKFLSEDLKELIQQLRELGRQPLTAQTGNLTVITTAFAAQKGNAAIQAWAINLKDALERALSFVALWLKEEQKAEVNISTDFDTGITDDKGPDSLLKMRAAGDLTQRTLWHEMKRRGILSAEFDPDTEEEGVIDELPGDIDDGTPAPPDKKTPPVNPAAYPQEGQSSGAAATQ